MADLATTWNGFSLRRQTILIGAGVVLISALIAAIYLLAFRQNYEPLYANLRAAEAAAIVDELEKANVAHRLADGGATIMVPNTQADEARLKIASSDLTQRGLVGFEVFNKTDMGLTEFAQRVNYQRALQGELARTILAIDGVEAVRVHLSITEPNAFMADNVAPRASLTITPRKGVEISPALALGIQKLVAAAVPHLTPDAVVVLDARGVLLSDNAMGALAAQAPPPRPVATDASVAEGVAAVSVSAASAANTPPATPTVILPPIPAAPAAPATRAPVAVQKSASAPPPRTPQQKDIAVIANVQQSMRRLQNLAVAPTNLMIGAGIGAGLVLLLAAAALLRSQRLNPKQQERLAQKVRSLLATETARA
jgi:flagellar M-ring protein FliF